MSGIFISGGSGLGKSHCVQRICDTYPTLYPVIGLNDLILNSDNFWDYDFITRQIALILRISTLHLRHNGRDERMVADRSVIDYLVWTRIPPCPAYGLLWERPTLQVIVPTPSLDWYQTWMKEWRKKIHRLKSYLERFTNFPDMSDHISDESLASQVWMETQRMEEQMRGWVAVLGWPNFIPVIDRDSLTYQDQWQEQVLEYIALEGLV